MSENDQSHLNDSSLEGESNLDYSFLEFETDNPLEVQTIEHITTRLLDHNLANLRILEKPLEGVSRLMRIRDFTPRPLVNAGLRTHGMTTKDLLFMQYLTAVTHDEYLTLAGLKTPPEEAIDKVKFNLNQIIDRFAARSGSYEALTDYFDDEDGESARKLVSTVTSESTGVVEILDNPLLTRVMVEDFALRPEFRDALFRSNDPVVKSSLMAKFDAVFSGVYSYGGLGLSDSDFVKSWAQYFVPLTEAATLENPNLFAVHELVKLYQRHTGTLLALDPRKGQFHSNKDYEMYRNLMESIREITYTSVTPEFNELALDIIHAEQQSIGLQLSHFIAILHTRNITGEPNPHLYPLIQEVYPSDSPLKESATVLFSNEDKQEATQRGLHYALRTLASSDVEIGPAEQEFLIKKCLNYLSLSDVESIRVLFELAGSRSTPESVSQLIRDRLGF